MLCRAVAAPAGRRTFSGTGEVTGNTCVRHANLTGTINGANITFGFASAARPVTFTGILSGSTMSGTWEAVACGTVQVTLTGTWESTKQK